MMSDKPDQELGAKPGDKIDYELFLDCVHCGLCTASCPTYVETGNENDSPRGRIYLMRAVRDRRLPLTEEVQHHLDLCLDCRACETACPSGVQYGRLIEPFRIDLQNMASADDHGVSLDRSHDDWFRRHVLLGLFPYAEKMRRAILPARWMQRLGLWNLLEAVGAFRLLPPRLRQLTEMLPKLPRSLPSLVGVHAAQGKQRARVALFTGCVADVMFRDTHWATVRVLQANGCEVVVPGGQVCCGAIHLHAGSEIPARDLADRNVEEFTKLGVDYILVNVAGCGAMLKDYGHHWHDSQTGVRESFAGKIRDVHEFLAELGLIAPTGELPMRVTYHDACHLAHAQKIRSAPRELLTKIPGLTLVDLPESELCCGAAGTYNLTQPEMSGRLGRRKWDNVERTQASVVVTANAGCLLQMAREARRRRDRRPVLHPMDLLDLSYRKLPLTKR